MGRQIPNTGRVARVRLTDEQLANLQAGGSLTIRLQPNTEVLKLSRYVGEFDQHWDKLWEDFGKLFDDFGQMFKNFRLRK